MSVVRVDWCQSNSTKGSRGSAERRWSPDERTWGGRESLFCLHLEPAPSCSSHGQYLIMHILFFFFSFFLCLFLIVILKDTGKHRLGLQTPKSPPSIWKGEGWENNNLSPHPPQLPLPSWRLQLAEEELEGQQCPVSPQPLLGCAGPHLGGRCFARGAQRCWRCGRRGCWSWQVPWPGNLHPFPLPCSKLS